tara:strand:+ start:23198 stop:23716 length:519 start_codon:yes stop_codon:yes gene_type:complete
MLRARAIGVVAARASTRGRLTRARPVRGLGRSSTTMATATTDDEDHLYQFIILRKDLGRALGWPLGALAAQCAHAAVAAVWKFSDREETRAYCAKENIAGMRKVVLETKNENALRKLSETLAADGVEHELWTEQPENVPTCLATRPYRRSAIGGYFKKCNLAKDACVAPTAK